MDPFNTNQILGEFNSGGFLGNKANLWFEGHHNSSDGYQTFNDQQRTAGYIEVQLQVLQTRRFLV